MTYRIVNTDNFGSDYPNEKFIGATFTSKDGAQAFADSLNNDSGEDCPRYFKVVQMPYKLQPGFEP